ncbi:MAG: NUDIX domain-containing protein [Cellulosilyticaceae bacterium]
MGENKTNWGQSVAGVVVKDGKVLLARHTYGNGNGMLIVPGGYVNHSETPQEALKREFLEEVSIVIEPKEIIGIRFNFHDWYVVFSADYVSGEAQTDHAENSEVVWMDLEEVMEREDIPELTKQLVECAKSVHNGLVPMKYTGNLKHGPSSFYGIK